MMIIRPATATDLDQMSSLLSEILHTWRSSRSGTPEHIKSFYIDHPDQISCLVAQLDTDRIAGFQSLKRVGPNNDYGVPSGWGVIGTYVDLSLPRLGVGRRLFEETLKCAQNAGLEFIDATMKETNENAVSYYEAMGFRTYRTEGEVVSKSFVLP